MTQRLFAHGFTLSGASRQLSQRESHWRVGGGPADRANFILCVNGSAPLSQSTGAVRMHFGKQLLPMGTGPGILRRIGPKRTVRLVRPAKGSPTRGAVERTRDGEVVQSRGCPFALLLTGSRSPSAWQCAFRGGRPQRGCSGTDPPAGRPGRGRPRGRPCTGRWRRCGGGCTHS